MDVDFLRDELQELIPAMKTRLESRWPDPQWRGFHYLQTLATDHKQRAEGYRNTDGDWIELRPTGKAREQERWEVLQSLAEIWLHKRYLKCPHCAPLKHHRLNPRCGDRPVPHAMILDESPSGWPEYARAAWEAAIQKAQEAYGTDC